MGACSRTTLTTNSPWLVSKRACHSGGEGWVHLRAHRIEQQGSAAGHRTVPRTTGHDKHEQEDLHQGRVAPSRPPRRGARPFQGLQVTSMWCQCRHAARPRRLPHQYGAGEVPLPLVHFAIAVNRAAPQLDGCIPGRGERGYHGFYLPGGGTMRARSIISGTVLAWTVVLVPQPAVAQGTLDDYRRAANVRQRLEGLTVGWPRRRPGSIRTASGTAGRDRWERLRLVDATTQRKQPAFDHANLATGLSLPSARSTRNGRCPSAPSNTFWTGSRSRRTSVMSAGAAR